MTTIVKIQRLQATAGEQRQLIYNQERTVVYESPLDPDIDKLMGQQNKVYAKAKIRKGRITVLGLIRPQAW